MINISYCAKNKYLALSCAFKLIMSLKKVIEIKREQAVYTNPKKDPYDVLIEEYEEGMDSKKLDEIFLYLKTEICELLKKIKNTEKYKNQKKIMYYVKRNEQKEIVKKLIKKMGIREDRLSIDTSMHPFSTMISQNDVRITTKYSNPIESFFASIHEAGHALYDLGLPKKYHDTVVYDAASFGMHESQSIFWENMICKNEVFWKGYFKKYKHNIKIDATWKEFYEYVNHVKPTFIRMDADEVTYCLHIIIRYEIEKDLIQGKLKVKDVKKVWNEKSKELLGIVPKDDNDGVLQDIHWADGDFGYFPSYALGMIYSVQLFNDIKKRKVDDMIMMQDFKLILEYLRKNVHSKGKTMTAEEIIIKCCGKGLDPKQFVEYLNEKYSKIYGFSNNS